MTHCADEDTEALGRQQEVTEVTGSQVFELTYRARG